MEKQPDIAANYNAMVAIVQPASLHQYEQARIVNVLQLSSVNISAYPNDTNYLYIPFVKFARVATRVEEWLKSPSSDDAQVQQSLDDAAFNREMVEDNYSATSI